MVAGAGTGASISVARSATLDRHVLPRSGLEEVGRGRGAADPEVRQVATCDEIAEASLEEKRRSAHASPPKNAGRAWRTLARANKVLREKLASAPARGGRRQSRSALAAVVGKDDGEVGKEKVSRGKEKRRAGRDSDVSEGCSRLKEVLASEAMRRCVLRGCPAERGERPKRGEVLIT
jgi:hypothetical protein